MNQKMMWLAIFVSAAIATALLLYIVQSPIIFKIPLSILTFILAVISILIEAY